MFVFVGWYYISYGLVMNHDIITRILQVFWKASTDFTGPSGSAEYLKTQHRGADKLWAREAGQAGLRSPQLEYTYTRSAHSTPSLLFILWTRKILAYFSPYYPVIDYFFRF